MRGHCHPQARNGRLPLTKSLPYECQLCKLSSDKATIDHQMHIKWRGIGRWTSSTHLPLLFFNMKFLLLLTLLPALAAGVTNFDDCDGVVPLLCFADADCGPGGSEFVGATCKSSATAPVVAGSHGCCVGGTADGTTTTTAATTVAGSITTVSSTSCVDKLNPLTGVSDCPARSTLCTNSVYLDVMRDQCPKTCGFCTGTGTVTNSTITSCVDRVNPSTNISDCPTMKAYCNNTIYKPLMTIQCPATCGFCTSG